MNLKDVLAENEIYQYIENIRCQEKREKILSKCSVVEYKKGDIFYFSPEEEEKAMIILEGRLNIRIYVTDEKDYVVPWDNAYWLGTPWALSEKSKELEIDIMEDAKVLYLPLKELLYADPRENVGLWMKLSKMAVKKYMDIQKKTVERAALSTDTYFMKSLAEHGYNYMGMPIQEISYELNISTRTLQRVVQGLVQKGYIERDRSKQCISMTESGKCHYHLEK